MDVLINSIKEVSVIGSSPVIFILAFLAVAYFFVRRDYLRILTLVLSFCSGIYSTLLKGIFEEGRPVGYTSVGFIPWDKILVWEGFSFPSTHTVLYTVFFGYLFYLSYKLKNVDKLLQHTVRIASAILVVFVGISRILLGAHFVKDVVFGYFFGAVYLAALIIGERFWEQRRARKLLKHK